MRSRLNILVAAAAAILVVPQFATAGSVEDQLQVMNDRMGQLEDQLQATQDELDASTDTVERQGDVIEKAGLARQAKSGLSSFYDQVQISGWLAVSYFFNDNNPDSAIIEDQNWSHVIGYGVNNTTTNLVAPFHPDHNSFSVDQLWFEIEKPVTEESRGGFRADLVWGNTASILAFGIQRLCGSSGDTIGAVAQERTGYCIGDEASDFSLYQAYVQYLTPFGPTLKAGKFGTLIGYEVAGTIYNFNVTRGLVYTALQPINHYGILLDGQTDGGIVYGLGVVNDASDAGPDFNNSKHILARLGWAGEKASVLANMLWGNEEYGGRHDPFITADLVATFDPIESLSTWLNFTYKQHMSGGPNDGLPMTPADYGYTRGKPEGWGIAAAARYAINDRLGLALRGEFIQDNRNLFGATDRMEFPTDLDAWGFTLTADYAITDNLTLKAEGRFDRFDFIRRPDDPPTDTAVSADGSGGISERDNFKNRNNWLTGAELVYQF